MKLFKPVYENHVSFFNRLTEVDSDSIAKQIDKEIDKYIRSMNKEKNSSYDVDMRKFVRSVRDMTNVAELSHAPNELIMSIAKASSMPVEAQKERDSWKIVNKSPYSQSYYNSWDIDWDHKPEGSLRISDHWNFYSKGKDHCVTDIKGPVWWALGKYDNGIYKILKQYKYGSKDKELYRKIIFDILGRKSK